MKSPYPKVYVLLISILVVLSSCNLPTGSPQVREQVLVVVTATPETDLPAAAVPAINTVSAVAAPCYPMVTANVDSNIRKGPDTVYEIVGYLPQGGTAKVAGRNDTNTWWYIEFASGVGGYAWIAGSITTASCLPTVVQVVAAPPPPVVVVPPAEEEQEEEAAPGEEPPPPAAAPDLGVSEYTRNPDPPTMDEPVQIRVGVYNYGNAAAGAFTVQWWASTGAPTPACTWPIASLVAHGGYIKTCIYHYPSWYGHITTQVVVDSGNSVDESDEGNNVASETIPVLQPYYRNYKPKI